MNTEIIPSPLAYLVINVSVTTPYIKAPINKEALGIKTLEEAQNYKIHSKKCK